MTQGYALMTARVELESIVSIVESDKAGEALFAGLDRLMTILHEFDELIRDYGAVLYSNCDQPLAVGDHRVQLRELRLALSDIDLSDSVKIMPLAQAYLCSPPLLGRQAEAREVIRRDVIANGLRSNVTNRAAIVDLGIEAVADQFSQLRHYLNAFDRDILNLTFGSLAGVPSDESPFDQSLIYSWNVMSETADVLRRCDEAVDDLFDAVVDHRLRLQSLQTVSVQSQQAMAWRLG